MWRGRSNRLKASNERVDDTAAQVGYAEGVTPRALLRRLGQESKRFAELGEFQGRMPTKVPIDFTPFALSRRRRQSGEQGGDGLGGKLRAVKGRSR